MRAMNSSPPNPLSHSGERGSQRQEPEALEDTARRPSEAFLLPSLPTVGEGGWGGEGKPVRVCFLIDRLAAAGTEMQLLALIRHLDRRKVSPYLVLLRGEDESSRRLEPDDCPVLHL